jgi:hypothetical protein
MVAAAQRYAVAVDAGRISTTVVASGPPFFASCSDRLKLLVLLIVNRLLTPI